MALPPPAASGAMGAMPMGERPVAALKLLPEDEWLREEIEAFHATKRERDEALSRIADLETLLLAEREKVAALTAPSTFAARSEAELVARAFPANALKHSR